MARPREAAVSSRLIGRWPQHERAPLDAAFQKGSEVADDVELTSPLRIELSNQLALA